MTCFYRFEYLWADGTNVKKPIKCSAPKYIDYLMTWVQEQLDDETLFPSKIGMILCVVLATGINKFVIYIFLYICIGSATEILNKIKYINKSFFLMFP